MKIMKRICNVIATPVAGGVFNRRPDIRILITGINISQTKEVVFIRMFQYRAIRVRVCMIHLYL